MHKQKRQTVHREFGRVPNQEEINCRTQGQLQEYLNLLDWRGLELSSTGKMCKTSVKRFERPPVVWAAWIKLKETLVECRRTRDAEEGDEAMSEAAKQKRESDASPAEFYQAKKRVGREPSRILRTLAEGNVWDSLADLQETMQPQSKARDTVTR